MEEILIFGHKNPDTDTICSAIAYSYLKNKLGFNTKAVRLGEINEETKYALEYFNITNIEKINDVSGKNIILVDHNERTQTADGFEDAKVLELIDHHKISNFNVSDPLFVRVEPIGCTASIIFKMYKENGIEIPEKIAGIMLSAIISDSLLFKSPTCTKEDIEIAKKLSEIANVDAEKYGLEMLKAGANLSSKTEKEILNMDMKIFEMGKNNVAIAQVNTFNISEILDRKEKLLFEMDSYIKENNLLFYLFVITDVLQSTSLGLVLGSELDKVEKAFNSNIKNNEIKLEGIVSRKKQVVPPLSKIFIN